MMLIFLLYFAVIFTIYWYGFRWYVRRFRQKNTIGIFHLYCASGGGGERVLWRLLKTLLDKYPRHTIYIYTHGKGYHDAITMLVNADTLFKINLISHPDYIERLMFMPMSLAPLVQAHRYPFLTLFLQNLMSILVGIQAAYTVIPEMYFETMGFSFTLPIFKYAGSSVITYVHYPIISSDMISNVRTSTHASFNNREIFVRSPVLRMAKLIYYKLLAYLYGFAGRCADLVLVNSSWTQAHIKSLWNCETNVVYPPCDIESFKQLPLDRFANRPPGKLNIVSLAQFRPEKNHQLQIEAFDLFLTRTKNASDSHLTLYGGCRDAGDRKRVEYLRDLVHRLDLSSRVSIIVNAEFDDLLEAMHKADVAIHTMANEHFGIVLLEFMAAGLITVAHNSGGPQTDIIDNERNGFLCDDVEDFADVLWLISKMKEADRRELRERAVKKSEQFSNDVFEQMVLEKLAQLPLGCK